MKPCSVMVAAAISLMVCSCSDMQADYFCDNTITLDNGGKQRLTKLPHPDKWEVNEKYKVKWTMDKVENSARSARMQKICN